MSISIVKNTTDTTPSGDKPSIEVVGLNYATDFRMSQKSTADRTCLINVTSPRDAQENMILAATNVRDIYSGSNIDPAYRDAVRRGTSILVQLNDVWTLKDSADDKFRVDLPISAHLVIKVPSSYVTAADVKSFVGRMLGGLFETGSSGTSRIDALMRGITIPKDL